MSSVKTTCTSIAEPHACQIQLGLRFLREGKGGITQRIARQNRQRNIQERTVDSRLMQRGKKVTKVGAARVNVNTISIYCTMH